MTELSTNSGLRIVRKYFSNYIAPTIYWVTIQTKLFLNKTLKKKKDCSKFVKT